MGMIEWRGLLLIPALYELAQTLEECAVEGYAIYRRLGDLAREFDIDIPQARPRSAGASTNANLPMPFILIGEHGAETLDPFRDSIVRAATAPWDDPGPIETETVRS